MSKLVETASPPATVLRTELWFRRILLAFAFLAAVCLLGQLAMLFWAQNAFTGGECVVAAHSTMLARDGTLYYDLNHYPYTVAPYTPLYYLLDAGLQKLGLPAYTAGRLISFLALTGIVALAWFIALLYTKDRYTAATATLVCASSTLLLYWGTVGQVDVLALFWSLAAFYLYSRYAILGERTLIRCGLCVLLAFFTKQTFLACPAAIFLLLWFRNRKLAIQFGAACFAIAAVVALTLDTLLHGRFLADTVRANLNPYSSQKLLSQLRFTLLTASPLVLIAALGARQAIRPISSAPFVYLGFATLTFLSAAPKVGADLNYQLEFTVLLMLCAALSLHALDFFRLSFVRSRSWITLLQLPLGVFLAVNCRASVTAIVTHYAAEQQTRAEFAAVKNSLANSGRVLSADYNALVRLRGRLDVEMAFYRLLVDSGLVDPEPLRRDLAASAFSTVVLLQDARDPEGSLDMEISTLPAPLLEEVRNHYRLVERIPGPALNGVYVYKPRARNGQ